MPRVSQPFTDTQTLTNFIDTSHCRIFCVLMANSFTCPVYLYVDLRRHRFQGGLVNIHLFLFIVLSISDKVVLYFLFCLSVCLCLLFMRLFWRICRFVCLSLSASFIFSFIRLFFLSFHPSFCTFLSVASVPVCPFMCVSVLCLSVCHLCACASLPVLSLTASFIPASLSPSLHLTPSASARPPLTQPSLTTTTTTALVAYLSSLPRSPSHSLSLSPCAALTPLSHSSLLSPRTSPAAPP